MHRPLLRALSRIYRALLRIQKHHNLEIQLSKEPYIFSKEPLKKPIYSEYSLYMSTMQRHHDLKIAMQVCGVCVCVCVCVWDAPRSQDRCAGHCCACVCGAPRSQARRKEPYTFSKEPSKEPYAFSKEPCIFSKQPSKQAYLF